MIRNGIAPLVLALAGTAALAQAQAAMGKVGVINIQSAIVTTKDGQKAAAELDAKAAPKRKTLEAKQNEINSLKDQLQKGSNALSETAKQEIVRNIDTKTKSFNRDMEDAQAEVEQDQQKVLQDLGGRIMAVIDKYAKDNGFVLILDVSSPQTPVMFASNTIDVTKDIIDLYDKAAASGTTTNVVPGAGSRPVPGTTSNTPRTTSPATSRPPATTRPAAPATSTPPKPSAK
ncbi:MAG: OmpH family outer membrane protein [Acidobacteriota bacterium]|nr:OmpH family outer membrane protein [Acidobacteriota bacterium]